VRLSALDRWTLGYAAFATLAVLVHAERLPHPWLLLLGHGVLGAVALVAHRARARSGVVLFLGEFYPLVLVVILYAEIGHVNAMVGLSHDARVQRWEEALFASQPSREWIRAWPLPWLSALFHAAYLSYYFILAGAPLAPWAVGRTRQAAWVALLMVATFYLCYAVFLCFPVAGPRYTCPLADNEATRTALARFTQRLLNQGAAWGTAFPSSHVAVSLVASVAGARALPASGMVLVPLAVLLTLATVYGQFHYAVDALAGAAVAALVLGVGFWRWPSTEDQAR
jgi:membrane-associated phospholipid phosphatase